jgi:hypothetical protein
MTQILNLRLWVAHPDFVRLAMAVVLAYPNPNELQRLVSALVVDQKAVGPLVSFVCLVLFFLLLFLSRFLLLLLRHLRWIPTPHCTPERCWPRKWGEQVQAFKTTTRKKFDTTLFKPFSRERFETIFSFFCSRKHRYLTDWLMGRGCVALPAELAHPSGAAHRGVVVRVMDDLATTERSRWEV